MSRADKINKISLILYENNFNMSIITTLSEILVDVFDLYNGILKPEIAYGYGLCKKSEFYSYLNYLIKNDYVIHLKNYNQSWKISPGPKISYLFDVEKQKQEQSLVVRLSNEIQKLKKDVEILQKTQKEMKEDIKFTFKLFDIKAMQEEILDDHT